MKITDKEWQLLRQHYGDLAYEEPHRHREMFDLIRPRPMLVVDNTKK